MNSTDIKTQKAGLSKRQQKKLWQQNILCVTGVFV
jgi:hypothetical protein